MFSERRRFAVGLGAFALASVINPAYVTGCTAEGENGEPDFGEAELLQVLSSVNDAGAWSFEDQGAQYELALTLEQKAGEDVLAQGQTGALFRQVARACGQRTFMKSASACITSTAMPVTGEMTLRKLGDGSDAPIAVEAVAGELRAWGSSLDHVELMLSFGDNQVWLQSHNAAPFELVELQAQALGEAALDIDYAAEE